MWRTFPPSCNVIETRVGDKLVDSTWHDCGNPNCPTSDAK
jgi:hypothetical protein